MLPCRAALFLRRGAAKQEAVTSNSATTRVSIAQAERSENSGRKIDSHGNVSDRHKRREMREHDPQRSSRRMRHAQPVGPLQLNSPLSVKVTAGASVQLYTNQRNKKHRTRANQFRLRGEWPRAIHFAPGFRIVSF